MEVSPQAAMEEAVHVLILIIMEDTHGANKPLETKKFTIVLILIIMEDTHGESRHISP